jgi:hypothetical protein
VSGWREIVRGSVACAGAAAAVAAVACVSVGWAGEADEARAWFALGFAAPSGTWSEAARIAADNLRLAAAPYLAAWALRHSPRLRPLTDSVLAFILVANAALVGAAFGAYGPELASALVPHLPLELGAFSLAGGTYVAARTNPLRLGVALWVAGVVVSLLLVAACAEVALWLD